MIRVLIRPRHEDGSRTVHGVLHLAYDPARMDVLVTYPNPRKPTQLVEERVPIVPCVGRLKKTSRLAAREILEALRPRHPGLTIETDSSPPRQNPSGPGGEPDATVCIHTTGGSEP